MYSIDISISFGCSLSRARFTTALLLFRKLQVNRVCWWYRKYDVIPVEVCVLNCCYGVLVCETVKKRRMIKVWAADSPFHQSERTIIKTNVKQLFSGFLLDLVAPTTENAWK